MSPPKNPRQGAAAAADVSDVSDVSDVADLSRQSDTNSPIRLGFWVLVVGFGLFIAWAAFAPLDEGVSAQAQVSIETRRKAIQHLQGGVIKELPVKEGEQVKAGAVLLVLDDGTTRAVRDAIQQNYLAQRAMESRLLAELSGTGAISFHPDLIKATESDAKLHMTVQTQLFNARRAALAAEAAAAQETINGFEAQGKGLRLMLDSRQQQAALQNEQVANVKSLAQDGFAPRNQALQLEQSQAELRAGMADLAANGQRVLSSIAETRLRVSQRKQDYLKEASAQLADVRREVQANQEKLAAITTDLERTEIRSPVDGQVVGLGVSGVGSVLTPGQKLMDIVPVTSVLLLDTKVPTHVIDRVHVGDPTEVRFSGFANSPQLVVDGQVVSLSTDAVSEQMGGSVITYYLARVAITESGLKALGPRVMQPGMPAEVLIRTGERSLLTYLMHPLTKRIAASMKEE